MAASGYGALPVRQREVSPLNEAPKRGKTLAFAAMSARQAPAADAVTSAAAMNVPVPRTDDDALTFSDEGCISGDAETCSTSLLVNSATGDDGAVPYFTNGSVYA